MCYNGYSGGPEDECEQSAPWESDGDVDFLPDTDADNWRQGFPMGPEEAAFRKQIEDGEGGDGA